MKPILVPNRGLHREQKDVRFSLSPSKATSLQSTLLTSAKPKAPLHHLEVINEEIESSDESDDTSVSIHSLASASKFELLLDENKSEKKHSESSISGDEKDFHTASSSLVDTSIQQFDNGKNNNCEW